MKRILLASLAFMTFSFPVFAQDSAGVYIPGMPVPQKSEPAPAAVPAGQPGPAAESRGNENVSKVSKSEGPYQRPAPAAEPPAEPAARPGYKGVTPPTRTTPQNASTFTKVPGNQLSWIGFMPEDNSHRIFVQTSQPTRFERLATPEDRVEILVSDTKLAVSNNNRELDMRFFQTPFAKAKATQAGRDVKVVVQLKQPTHCEVRQHDNMIDIVANK